MKNFDPATDDPKLQDFDFTSPETLTTDSVTGTTIIGGRVRMRPNFDVPQNPNVNDHMRQVSVRLPLFEGQPVIVVTVASRTDNTEKNFPPPHEDDGIPGGNPGAVAPVFSTIYHRNSPAQGASTLAIAATAPDGSRLVRREPATDENGDLLMDENGDQKFKEAFIDFDCDFIVMGKLETPRETN
ncbi:MAG: hypothetical protein ACRCXL_17095 [Dermatophilaceae bacterium]